MNATTVATVLKMFRAAWPSMEMDEYTPHVWFDALTGITDEVGLEAGKRLTRVEEFPPSVARLRAEAAKIRNESHPALEPGPLPAIPAGHRRVCRHCGGEVFPDHLGSHTKRATAYCLACNLVMPILGSDDEFVDPEDVKQYAEAIARRAGYEQKRQAHNPEMRAVIAECMTQGEA